MYLTPTTSLGQGILDPTVKSRTAAIIRQKIKQGERDMNKLASSHCYDAFAMRVAGYAAARSDITRCRARPVEGHQRTSREGGAYAPRSGVT